MKNISRCIVVQAFALLMVASSSFAQLTIVVKMDPLYRSGGKVELSLSGFGDELTDFYGVFPDQNLVNKITICGKIGTADSTRKKLGLIQLNPDGSFNTSFGLGGKTIMNWGISDFPNTMYVSPIDNSVVLGGMNAASEVLAEHRPTLFKFDAFGKPDLSFGVGGHAIAQVDSVNGGYVTNVYPEDSSYLACGAVMGPEHPVGFCAIKYNPHGILDSSFGKDGISIIPAQIGYSAGFLTTNDSIVFVAEEITGGGISPKSAEIIIGKLDEKGKPVSSFGINGILRTGVKFNPLLGSLRAAIQPNYNIVCSFPPIGISPLEPIHMTRFLPDGTVDTSFGTKGDVVINFTNGISRANGITVAKNGKSTIAGSALNALDQCAAARLNVDGSPDISFNLVGTTVIDVDSGAHANWLTKLIGIGNKRYYGVGTSVHNGIPNFMIVRFKDDTTFSRIGLVQDNDGVAAYPNPAVGHISITSANALIKSVSLYDAIGRRVDATEMRENEKSTTLTLTQLPAGMYHCVIETSDGVETRKIIIGSR
ncbi:MAG: T9SS type A sorting domain-containing protein [bacterium]